MDGSSRGLLRSIICGCADWPRLGLLDDDVDFRSRTWHLSWGVLRADVVYSRGADGLWRLCSVGLTVDDLWVADYGYAAGAAAPSHRVWEYRAGVAARMRAVANLDELPAGPRIMLRALHPWMLKLCIVSRLLPIPDPPAALQPAPAPAPRRPPPGRPPRPPLAAAP